MKIVGTDYYTACAYSFAQPEGFALYLTNHIIGDDHGSYPYVDYLKDLNTNRIYQSINADIHGAIKPLFVVVGYKIYWGLFVYENQGFDIIIRSFWNNDELDAYLNDNPKSKTKLAERNNIKNWFKVETIPETLTDWMRITETPILIGMESCDPHDIRWYTNPANLKDIEFNRVLDAWVIYQEIDMWINSEIVAKEPVMVTLSNSSKRDKHGFDNKSFKKEFHQGKPRGNR